MADDGKVYIEIDLDDRKAISRVAELDDRINKLGGASSGGATGIDHLSTRIGIMAGVGAVAGQVLVDIAKRVFGLFAGGISAAVQASAQFNTAMTGLGTVANAFGITAAQASDAARALAADGLMSVKDAAEGLKNLLSTGFSLPESIKLMQVFKDSAAFGAQGMLSMGEAVVRATQGIKFGNSALTDSTGLGKNLSVIMREAGMAESMMGLAASNAAVRQAILNGFLREGAIFAGDAAKKAETYSGQTARLANAWDMLMVSVGNYITNSPVVLQAIDAVTDALVDQTNSLNENNAGYGYVADGIIGLAKTGSFLLQWVNQIQMAWNAMQRDIYDLVVALAESSAAIWGWGLQFAKALQLVPGSSFTNIEQSLRGLQAGLDGAQSAAYQFRLEAKAQDDQIYSNRLRIVEWQDKLDNLVRSMEGARVKTGHVTTESGRLRTQQESLSVSTNKYKSEVEKTTKSLGNLATEVASANARGNTATEIYDHLGKRLLDAGEDAKFLEINVRKISVALDEAIKAAQRFRLAEILAEANAEARKLFQEVLKDQTEKIKEAADRRLQIEYDASKKALELNRSYHEEVAKQTLNQTDYRIFELNRWRDEEKASLDKSASNYDALVKQIDGIYSVRMREILNRSQDDFEDWYQRLSKTLQDVGELFERLGEQGEGGWSRVAQGAGAAMSTIGGLVEQRRAGYGNWGQLGSAWANAQASGEWQDYVGAGAMTAGAVYEGGTLVLEKTNVRGRGNRAIAGAMAGAQEGGQYGGPYGAMGGAVVGAIIGAVRNPGFEDIMNRTFHRFGENISEDLAKQLDAIDKGKEEWGGSSRQDWGREEVEIANLGKIAKEIGLDDSNIDKMSARLRDVFTLIQSGKMTVEDVRTSLAESFPLFAAHMAKSTRIAGKEFQDVIKLHQQYGIESAEVNAFVLDQTARAGNGVIMMMGPLQQEYGGLAEKIAATQAAMAEMTASGQTNTEEYAVAAASLSEMLAKQSAGAATAAVELDRLGLIAVAAFNGARENGATLLESLDAMGPSIDNLIALHKDLGFTEHNAALQTLVDFRERVKANKGLVMAAEGLNETMLSMSNIGHLNADTLRKMEDQGLLTYDRLRAAGFSNNETMEMMKGFVENVIRAHDQLGIPIDENTQKLIDQAREAGVLKDKGKDMTEVFKEGFGAMIKALGGELPASWQAAAKAAEEANKKTKTSTKEAKDGILDAADAARTLEGGLRGVADAAGRIEFPDAPDYSGVGNTSIVAHGGAVIAPYARRYHGGTGLAADEVPAILQTGEGVLSRRAMQVVGALNRGNVPSGMGGSGLTIHAPVTVQGDFLSMGATQKKLTSIVEKSVMRAVRNERKLRSS